jgi:hypothetical protein
MCIACFSLRRRDLPFNNLRRTPKAQSDKQVQLEKGKQQQQQPTWSEEHQPKKDTVPPTMPKPTRKSTSRAQAYH